MCAVRGDGLNLRATGADALGVPLAFVWKAWERGDTCRWELRRVLETIGYKTSGQNWQPDDIISSQMNKWRAFALGLGMQPFELYGRSANSLRFSGASEDELACAETEYWVSSAGLLMVLCFWSNFRKGDVAKQRVHAIIRALLEQTVLADTLPGISWMEMPAEVKALCNKGNDAHGFCSCWNIVVARAANLSKAPHANAAGRLAVMAQMNCPTLAKLLGQHVAFIGEAIDHQRGCWGDTNLKHCKELTMQGPSGKRRRVDRDALREILCSDSQGAGSIMNPTAHLSVKDLHRGVHKIMGAHKEASTMAFIGKSSAGTVCCTWDAVRLGSPASELSLHLLWRATDNLSCVLPPVVSLRY